MKKKDSIIAGVIFVVIVAIALCYGLVHNINSNREGKHKTEHKSHKNIHIAIVNEDKPTKYKDQKVELGAPFIQRLDNADKHNFETVSRGTAESGLKNGTYQVMVVIPEDFSKKAMQLDSKAPSRMALQYKTAVGQKENIAKETEQVVSSVLNEFNRDLIQIYFTSIFDNLHNAQTNVNHIMDRHNDEKKKFSNYLLDPLNDYSGMFSGIKSDSTKTNNDITKWIVDFNHSILSSKPSQFEINGKSAQEITSAQSEWNDKQISSINDVLSDYKDQKKDFNINPYISDLKSMNDTMSSQHKDDKANKKNYEKDFNKRIDTLKENVKSQESPFTKDMLKDYKKKLSDSLNYSADHNDELHQALTQMEQNNDDIRKNMEYAMVDSITKNNQKNDSTFIPTLTEGDLAQAGLNENNIVHYKEILQHVNNFKETFNKEHPKERIQQPTYHGELKGGDTSKLENKGIQISHNKEIKSKDINNLQLSLDPNFNYEGTVKINDETFDLKNSTIKLAPDKKKYKVSIDGGAKLKPIKKRQFTKDPKIKTQLLFGQVKRNVSDNDEPNDNQAHDNQDDEDQNHDDASNNDNQANDDSESHDETNIVDFNIEDNLSQEIQSPELTQQLKSLDRFESQYEMYATNQHALNNKTKRSSIIDMMVNMTTNELDKFKDDKTKTLDQIDSLKDSSDQFSSDIVESRNQASDQQDKLSKMISELDEMNKDFEQEPKEPKINKDKKDDFVELSTDLDDQVNSLSERSSELLSDSKSSKTTADSVSDHLDEMDRNISDLHASSRTLGDKANALNKDMVSDRDKDKLFADNFKEVLKNSKQGDKQNEALKAFMSNPVNKKNLENVLENSDDRASISPSVFVLVMYLVSLVTGYVISSYERNKGIPKLINNDFSKHNQIWNRILFTGIIAGIALLESLIIGMFATHAFAIVPGYKTKFMIITIVVMLLFVLVTTYLLRQLRSIGMLISMVMLGLYFVTLNSFTSTTSTSSVSKYSPINYIDTMIYHFLNQDRPINVAFIIIVLFMLLALGLNIVVKRIAKRRFI